MNAPHPTIDRDEIDAILCAARADRADVMAALCGRLLAYIRDTARAVESPARVRGSLAVVGE
jgi:hypothetical protein